MIRKLPFWIWIGGVLLTFCAGIVNAVAFLGFAHQAVSHVTGSVSRLSIALTQGQASLVWHLCAIVLGFFAGAVTCGAIVGDDHLQFGRRYGVALILESVLLIFAMAAMAQHSMLGEVCASAACGLQNAMVSTYSGAIVRTTHMTGLLTDLGALLGHRLRGTPLDLRRGALYVLLLSGFVAGGLAGALLFPAWGCHTLALPAALCGLAGTCYLALRYWRAHVHRPHGRIGA